MSTSLRSGGMSREEFFARAGQDDARFDVDGFAPAAMVCGTIGNARIADSPSPGRTDRIDSLRQYQSVASACRHVSVESRSIALTVSERDACVQAWTATRLTAGDVLHMPERGTAIPIAGFCHRVTFPA